jgi:hypothetical protein
MSIKTHENGLEQIGTLGSGAGLMPLWLICWHLSHDDTTLRISILNPGQKKTPEIRDLVLRIEK